MKYLLLLVSFILVGCISAPPERFSSNSMPRPMINAHAITLHPVSINGARPAEESLEKAVKTLRPFLQGEITIAPLVNHHLPFSVPTNCVVRLSNVKPSVTNVILGYVPAGPGIGRGVFTRFTDDHQQIVFSSENVRKMSMPFFSQEEAWILVQLHELGHVVGIPAEPDHTWDDGHCTNPRCVMYSKIDWRSILAGIVALGPPRSFCRKCTRELEAAKNL